VIRAFFEGPAGSGKTHLLIDEAVAVCRDLFIDPGQKLLALTFMNGSRQRLNARFSAAPQLRSRFVCLTFDSFAGSVTQRRRSLLRALTPERLAEGLNEFDRTCMNAARLIECPAVAAWMGASYPLVVVDEAQDLDPHRFRMLKAIAGASCLIAAADEFQNLNERINTAPVMEWLRAAEKRTTLTRIRRTSQSGLLGAAGALRDSKDVCQQLKQEEGQNLCHVGPGLRIIEAPAKNTGFLSWTVSNELAKLGPYAVILTPDGKGDTVRQVLDAVQTRSFFRNKKTGTTFGPFPMSWERREDEEATALLSVVIGEGELPLPLVIDAISAAKNAAGRHICDRLDKARNVRGVKTVTRERLGEIIQDALRDAGRYRPKMAAGRVVMTIQRAKNREFKQVLVLWPHSVTGGMDRQRRLLYNAITRTKERCAIVVFGQDRTKKPPFTS
jgi:hypothetical protein